MNITLYHLDLIYWNEDSTTINKDLFISKIKEIINKDEWIIDGNYGSTLELRMSKADTIIFFDINTSVCI